MLSRSTLQTKRHGSVKKSEQPEELENKIDKKLSRKIDSEKTINKHVYYISNGELSFEDGTINIPSSAFENNKEITSIILPSSLIEIERWAFQYCTKLTHIKLPEGLKKIERGAFERCSNLTHVELNKGLQEIGYFAFENCYNMKYVIYGGTNKQIISEIKSQLPTAVLINPSDLPDKFDTWFYQKQTVFLELKYSSSILSYEKKIRFLSDQNLEVKDQLILLKSYCPSMPLSVIEKHNMPLLREVFEEINAESNTAHYSGYQYLRLSEVYTTYCLLSKSNFFTNGVYNVSSPKNIDNERLDNAMTSDKS